VRPRRLHAACALTARASFIHDIKKATLVKSISSTQAIWTIYYTFPPPVSPRLFTVLQTSGLVTTPERAG
jgi:hypothetical protein